MRFRAPATANLRFKTLPVNIILLLLGVFIFPIYGTTVGAWRGLLEGLSELGESIAEVWYVFFKGA